MGNILRLNKIRRQIIHMHQFGENWDGRKKSLDDIIIEICAYTDLEVRGDPKLLKNLSEQLRRFCYGKTRTDEPTDDPKILKYIIDYLCHPEINKISKSDIGSGDVALEAIGAINYFFEDHYDQINQIGEKINIYSEEQAKNKCLSVAIYLRKNMRAFQSEMELRCEASKTVNSSIGFCISIDGPYEFSISTNRDIVTGAVYQFLIFGSISSDSLVISSPITSQPYSKNSALSQMIIENPSLTVARKYVSKLFELLQSNIIILKKHTNKNVNMVKLEKEPRIAKGFLPDKINKLKKIIFMSKKIYSAEDFSDMVLSNQIDSALKIIPDILDINRLDIRYGKNPLHISACLRSRVLVQAILTRSDTDLSVLSSDDHEAWELPILSEISPDFALSRFLAKLTREQRKSENIKRQRTDFNFDL